MNGGRNAVILRPIFTSWTLGKILADFLDEMSISLLYPFALCLERRSDLPVFHRELFVEQHELPDPFKGREIFWEVLYIFPYI